jgi:glycolate oxidase
VIPPSFALDVEQIVGPAFIRSDAASLDAYGADRKLSAPADLVVLPGSTSEVAAIAETCNAARVPLIVRGGGTGYTGGCVPVRGGVVMSLERLNRILEIDEADLLAVVEPNVITGVLQAAVEARGLFYPPDPASLNESVIGGNVAAGAGGPRAFKYGTTRHYVLGLEAVLPTGETIRTGSKAVKHAVGYDLTHLLVGSEGTLAIVTQVVLRLIPKPPVQLALRASFATVRAAVAAVDELVRARVVPATLELVDDRCLDAVSRYLGVEAAPPGTGAMLLIEVDGAYDAVVEEARRVEAACRGAGASDVRRAASQDEQAELWRVRREMSPALTAITPERINHDLVVPRGRVPQLFDLVDQVRRDLDLRIACFGHAGDGNIHVNILLTPGDRAERARARQAERLLFEGAVALEGSISGEHGIGVVKAPYLSLALSRDEIALMKRIKAVFDPNGILNPGKIFAD